MAAGVGLGRVGDGPWDMTAVNFGGLAELFVTNVLNDTVKNSPNLVDEGTVLRLLVTTPQYGLPKLLAVTTIGSGFPERTDPAALVVGPTGVGLGKDGTLYVADTAFPNPTTPAGSPLSRTRCSA